MFKNKLARDVTSACRSTRLDLFVGGFSLARKLISNFRDSERSLRQLIKSSEQLHASVPEEHEREAFNTFSKAMLKLVERIEGPAQLTSLASSLFPKI